MGICDGDLRSARTRAGADELVMPSLVPRQVGWIVIGFGARFCFDDRSFAGFEGLSPAIGDEMVSPAD
jgi:hypothetical protein